MIKGVVVAGVEGCGYEALGVLATEAGTITLWMDDRVCMCTVFWVRVMCSAGGDLGTGERTAAWTTHTAPKMTDESEHVGKVEFLG